MDAVVEMVAFGAFSVMALAGALGMVTTMSMFRSGIFLMASFVGVAGLFLLLQADLLGFLQIMMYVGGMLVMILFMVLFSHDPGGAMMSSMMELSGLEKLFSLGLARRSEHEEGGARQHEHERSGGEEAEGGASQPPGNAGQSQSASQHDGGHQGGHGGHDMSGMSMTTPIKRPAAILALATTAFFMSLIVLRPAWPLAPDVPDPASAERVGDLLMGKYMIAFEGAGLLILLGIFGAVYLSRPGAHPDRRDRDGLRAAVDGSPAPVLDPALEPLAGSTPRRTASSAQGHASHARRSD